MDALECLRSRRSVRAYLDKAVSREDIETMIDCARLAATAINIQPWEFVVVTDKAMLASIAKATDHGHHVAEASLCVCVFCKDTRYYLEDGCAATQNLLVAANALGLAGCWTAGDKKDYCETIRQLVGAPDDYKMVSLVPIGYPDGVPTPPKRPLEDVLHWETF